MKKFWIKNYGGDGFISRWLESVGVINITTNKFMRGIKGISRSPRNANWNGMDFDYFTVELSDKGLDILKPFITKISDEEIFLEGVRL